MTRRDVEVVVATLGIEGRRRGRRLYALCPYHDDRTPDTWSIAVSGKDEGRHHCFACGGGGGLLDLVARVLGLEVRVPGETEEDAVEAARVEARRWLEREVVEAPPVPVPERARMVVPETRSASFVLPPEVIVAPLRSWVTPARAYAERRGVTAEQVERWGLGYAVDGRLAGRIVVVVRDREGRPANYMARAFGRQERRYFYPDGRAGARKDVMFGEGGWPSEGRRGTVVVLEGAFNALALERAVPGVPFAALGGSDVRLGHLSRLATFPHVVVLTDNDGAGEEAAAALVAGLSRHSWVDRVMPREGPDLDELPPRELEALVSEAIFNRGEAEEPWGASASGSRR